VTTVKIETEGRRICGFTVSGHSGYAAAGSDIVCAGISSAVALVECAVNDILSLNARVRVDETSGTVSLTLPEKLSERQETTCQTLMAAFMLHMTSLGEDYPENILVLEENRHD